MMASTSTTAMISRMTMDIRMALLIMDIHMKPWNTRGGSGKTALMLALCRALHPSYNIGAVTNDIFTKEDAEFLIRHDALPKGRIKAIETGGCPHAAIREDVSANLGALEALQEEFRCNLLLIESGGDNLAGELSFWSFNIQANYSRELADYIIYVIDVSGGDKIPRKGGPGITQSDLLVVNKTDLAELVGADLGVMASDAAKMRDGGPTVFAQMVGQMNEHSFENDSISNHGDYVLDPTAVGHVELNDTGNTLVTSPSKFLWLDDFIPDVRLERGSYNLESEDFRTGTEEVLTAQEKDVDSPSRQSEGASTRGLLNYVGSRGPTTTHTFVFLRVNTWAKNQISFKLNIQCENGSVQPQRVNPYTHRSNNDEADDFQVHTLSDTNTGVGPNRLESNTSNSKRRTASPRTEETGYPETVAVVKIDEHDAPHRENLSEKNEVDSHGAAKSPKSMKPTDSPAVPRNNLAAPVSAISAEVQTMTGSDVKNDELKRENRRMEEEFRLGKEKLLQQIHKLKAENLSEIDRFARESAEKVRFLEAKWLAEKEDLLLQVSKLSGSAPSD
ncbi:hypothetical protein HDU96_005278 [Phlyctochytrium bullatum]|nr:hypothetical protein HDU96_005278 [Phlyctochytrium bullatum]